MRGGKFCIRLARKDARRRRVSSRVRRIPRGKREAPASDVSTIVSRWSARGTHERRMSSSRGDLAQTNQKLDAAGPNATARSPERRAGI